MVNLLNIFVRLCALLHACLLEKQAVVEKVKVTTFAKIGNLFERGA